MWADVKKGADPVADARRRRIIGKDARAGVGTLTALLDLYGAEPTAKRPGGPGASLKTWPSCRKMVGHVFAIHLCKPLATMKPGDLQMTADAHRAQQSAAAAVRYLRPVLKWASASGRGYVPRDLAQITPPATVRRRDRVLSRKELEQLLPALAASPRPYATAMRFMLLTLARREKVGAATWAAVDVKAGTWTISETKNGQPHIVPLSRRAVALLMALLPRDADGKMAPPDPGKRLFATATGTALGNWDCETKAIMRASKTEGWTGHDLRRTGATMLGDMGELPDIIEAALNHVSIRSALAATYNRSRCRPQ